MSQNTTSPSQVIEASSDSISKLIETHLTDKPKWKPSVVEEILQLSSYLLDLLHKSLRSWNHANIWKSTFGLILVRKLP
ncbi:unnamed protein product [Rhizopus stolonifer]